MISKEKLIYDSLLDEFKDIDHMISITEASRNTSGGRDFVISDYMAFNFDCFNAMRYGYNPEPIGDAKEKTPDCLFLKDDCLYFVEFKQGKAEKKDVRLKIHETILGIYNYSVQSKSVFSRSDFFNLKIKYILIKNGDKGQLSNPFYKRIYVAQNFFNLRYMNGFILESTHVFVDSDDITNFFHTITDGKCQPTIAA